jgi:hypothetical protein
MLDEADAVLDRPWTPPSIDERMGWGKHKDISYREAAAKDPGYLQWAAKKIEGVKGQLCAEALAVMLGVTE